MRTALNKLVGIVVMYRTRMLEVTGSKHDNSSFKFSVNLFSFFYLVSSFIIHILVWIRIKVMVRVSISCISAIKILVFS